MSVQRIGSYDDMGVWLDCNVELPLSSLETVPRGLGIGVILGAESAASSITKGLAEQIASLEPSFVHCFGGQSEVLHDRVDVELVRRGLIGVPTIWTLVAAPAEVIFELFRTDMPCEADFERWTGRLILIEASVSPDYRRSLGSCLCNVDRAVQTAINQTDHEL